MSDSETTTQPAGEAEQGATPTAEAATALGDPGKKALAAERDARQAAEKHAKTLQAQLDEFKRSQMTELERAQNDAQAAAAKLSELEGQLPKKVADELRGHLKAIHQIDDEAASLYLTSDDPATLLKQAMGIAPRSAATPKPDRTQGGTGGAPALNSDALENALRSKLGI